MATLGEKVAVVEEQIKQMRRVADERHEEMSTKIDKIIAGQQVGADDRAASSREIARIQTSMEKMAPHVETIANAKVFGVWSIRIGSGVASAAAGLWWFWDHFKQVVISLIGR